MSIVRDIIAWIIPTKYQLHWPCCVLHPTLPLLSVVCRCNCRCLTRERYLGLPISQVELPSRITTRVLNSYSKTVKRPLATCLNLDLFSNSNLGRLLCQNVSHTCVVRLTYLRYKPTFVYLEITSWEVLLFPCKT